MKLQRKHLPVKYRKKLSTLKRQYIAKKLPNDQLKAMINEDLMHLFQTREEVSIENTKLLCEFVKKTGKFPLKSNSAEEKRLSRFHCTKRRAKIGKGKAKFYSVEQEIAESYGLPNLFEQEDLEKISNEMITKLCTFVNDNNKLPTKNSKDASEKHMAYFLVHKRRAKLGKGNVTFYKSDQKIAESFDLDKIFDMKNLEKISNDKTIESCKFILKYGRNPYKSSKNKKEKKLECFIRTKRAAKKGTRRLKFYESDQKIAESFGIPNLFDPIDFESISNDNVKESCEFIIINKRLPRIQSSDLHEKKLAEFIKKKRANFRGTRRGKVYDSDIKIAESYGLPRLFGVKKSMR